MLGNVARILIFLAAGVQALRVYLLKFFPSLGKLIVKFVVATFVLGLPHLSTEGSIDQEKTLSANDPRNGALNMKYVGKIPV